MGGSVKVPKPTPEERELQRNQAELLALQREIIEQQRAQQAVLIPFLAEQEGFSVQTDENGNIIGISAIPDELDPIREEIERLGLERSRAALRGELPVSPALERELSQQERALNERLAAQFGPGFETSTPAIQTLGDFFEAAEGLREGARNAQLTLAEQLSIAREQQENASRAQSQQFLSQIATGNPLQLAGFFGRTAAGFGAAQQPFQFQRQLETQAAIANAQIGNPFAQIAGTAIGAIFSDIRLKTDIEPISKLTPDIDIVSFRWKHEVESQGDDAKRHIGVVAQQVAQTFPQAVSAEPRTGLLMVNMSHLRGLIHMAQLTPGASRHAATAN